MSSDQDKKIGGRCPLCGTAAQTDYRPFCSKRCQELDLARWLRGSYAIPGPPAAILTSDDDDDDDPQG